MAMQDDLLWDEPSVLTTSIDRLRHEIARCVGKSLYRDELHACYADTLKHREDILERLRQAAGQIA